MGMMECGVCGGWIHAKCEGLDGEEYQVLSLLPDSVEYVCKCSTPPTSCPPPTATRSHPPSPTTVLSTTITVIPAPTSLPVLQPTPDRPSDALTPPSCSR